MKSSSKKRKNYITPEKLYKIALYYLGRYEATEKTLKDVLLRKIKRAKDQGIDTTKAENEIDNIINKMKDYNYVNDARYAQNKAKELFLKGKSKKMIVQKLLLKGINQDIIEQTLIQLDEENQNNTDILAAINYAKKKRIGPFRKQLLEDSYKKELGKMARAGFDYEISKKIISAETKEELLEDIGK